MLRLMCLVLMPHPRPRESSLLSYWGRTKGISREILCLLDHLISEFMRGILEFRYQDSSYIILSQIYRGVHVVQLLLPSISLKTFSHLIGDALVWEFVSQKCSSLTWIVQSWGHALNFWVKILIKGCTSIQNDMWDTYWYLRSSKGVTRPKLAGMSPPNMGLWGNFVACRLFARDSLLAGASSNSWF